MRILFVFMIVTVLTVPGCVVAKGHPTPRSMAEVSKGEWHCKYVQKKTLYVNEPGRVDNSVPRGWM